MSKIPDILFQFFYKLAYSGLVVFAFIFRPALRGVNVAVWHAGKLLVIKNSYRREHTLPGGYLKGGESAKAAAVRELKEEVGLDVSPNQLRHFKQYFFKVHYKRETIDIFEFTVGSDVAISMDNHEVVWAGFMPPEEAVSKQLCLPAKQYLVDMCK